MIEAILILKPFLPFIAGALGVVALFFGKRVYDGRIRGEERGKIESSLLNQENERIKKRIYLEGKKARVADDLLDSIPNDWGVDVGKLLPEEDSPSGEGPAKKRRNSKVRKTKPRKNGRP